MLRGESHLPLGVRRPSRVERRFPAGLQKLRCPSRPPHTPHRTRDADTLCYAERAHHPIRPTPRSEGFSDTSEHLNAARFPGPEGDGGQGARAGALARLARPPPRPASATAATRAGQGVSATSAALSATGLPLWQCEGLAVNLWQCEGLPVHLWPSIQTTSIRRSVRTPRGWEKHVGTTACARRWLLGAAVAQGR